MFADPQSITINAIANSLPRTSIGKNSAEYTKDDSTVKLSVEHNFAKRTVRRVRLDMSKITADPLVPTQNQKVSASVYLVINHPVTGFSNTELKQLADGLVAWLSASSGANLTKVIGGES